ncbi:hypothetical protein [Escherichia coli]|uniref:hypothetical protein n=1 Tax=Escherichia coli TaxID=562 RepID=UPI003D9A57F7
MCRRGFEMDFAELLLEDYKASLKYLSDHPKLQGIAQQNSFKQLLFNNLSDNLCGHSKIRILNVARRKMNTKSQE